LAGIFSSCVQHQRPRLGDGLFHRQHTDKVIADAQVIALGFDIGVDHLIVEKLRGLRLARDAPVVVVEQPAEERELPLLVQHFDLHEVGKLAGECLHLLVEPARSFSICERKQTSSCCCW
jgi:hypothetical protein